jgi:hypothetical protein
MLVPFRKQVFLWSTSPMIYLVEFVVAVVAGMAVAAVFGGGK